MPSTPSGLPRPSRRSSTPRSTRPACTGFLGAVFIRFLEDNRLVDRPILSGAGERLELARERQQSWFRARPHDSDAEYLIATFSELARLPGLAGLFDPAHNPLFRLPLSGDGAMELIGFFRQLVPETGALTHDFVDPDWRTRWLGTYTRTFPRRRASAMPCCGHPISSRPISSTGRLSQLSASSATSNCG